MDKKEKLLAILVLILCTSSSISYAATLGTTGAQFLGINPGARPSGMGGAFVAVADDVNAIFWNPGGLAFLSNKEVTFTHNEWILDTRYEFAAFAYPLGSMTFGGSVFYLSTGEIIKRNKDGYDQEDPYEATDLAASLCYSQKLTGKLSIGANGRIISQKIEAESASSYQLDIGALYRLTPGLNLGVALQNMGTGIKFITESDPSPMNLKAGCAYRLPISFDSSLIIAGDINFRDNFIILNTGSELRGDRYSVRAGFQMVPIKLSMGGGLIFDKFSIDYGWMFYGELGHTHRVSVSMKF